MGKTHRNDSATYEMVIRQERADKKSKG